MNARSIIGSALAAIALFVGTQGCSVLSKEGSSGDEIKCTPGANVFCRCADRSEGTKLCKQDGHSFEDCTTGNGTCQGGEVEDPDTGKPVDENGKPVENDGGTTPATSDIETCPGKATAVTPGADIVIDGDTTGAKDDFKGKPGACAVGVGGPDHVYHLTPTGTGQLSIKVQATTPLNPTVYLRTTCNDENTQGSCAPPTGAGGLVQLSYNVVTGKDYYLIVDGASASAGKYKITMNLKTGSFCGDGKVDTNEACDDGNHDDNDGCSPGCDGVNGNPTTGNSCPGHTVHVWPGRKVNGTGSTVPYGNTFTKQGTSCTISTGSDLNVAQDHVYEVTAHGAGTLKVTATPEAAFNLQLVARTTCTNPATTAQNMCANNVLAGAAETMSFPVTNGQKVYVAVDGVLNGKGTYNVSFELQ
jgi:cysteine-rich repeat protein